MSFMFWTGWDKSISRCRKNNSTLYLCLVRENREIRELFAKERNTIYRRKLNEITLLVIGYNIQT